MIILEGKSLCARQKELNIKVKEAAQKQIPVQEIKSEENPDVDKIFKIKLASEYKDLDYVLEQLKSGDSLCVSKALKCEWIYGAEHAHIIHPDYLHHNIFPTMSLKLKKKTLSAISIFVRDETRAQLFCKYCLNTNMTNNAYKFLVFTPESFKEEFLNDNEKYSKLFWKVETNYFCNLIGNSFALANIYGQHSGRILDLRYLYSVDDQKYLDLFEKHMKSYSGTSIGVKLSRSLLKQHKNRILKNPAIYLDVLKDKELARYSSPQDAEVYLSALLPEDSNKFWKLNYCLKYKHIINLVAPEKQYQVIKTKFQGKYPTAEFEMSKDFYRLKYYEMMTLNEREVWALNHLQKQLDVIPESESYKWYKFVNFSKAFEEIKREISLACHDSKRSKLLNVLVKAAKTQQELKELLEYYCKRHINEKSNRKEIFVDKIIKHHKVLEFDEACWIAFDKILHSLQVYASQTLYSFSELVVVTLIYHIINKKTFPKGLYERINYVCIRSLNNYLDQLNDEKKNLVYNYMHQYIVDKITEFDTCVYNEVVKNQVSAYLRDYVVLQKYRKKLDEIDSYPDIVIKFMKLDLKGFGHLVEKRPEVEDEPKTKNWEGYLLRRLKQDSSLILEDLPSISEQYKNLREFRINMFLKKIKTYFPNDIGKQYAEYCIKTLYDASPEKKDLGHYVINSMVFAIFQLGGETIKTELMDKYVPTNPKIEYGKIDHQVLKFQQAICRFHCYSRPPIPLEKTTLYLKGDYVHSCDEMFNMYLANLPPALRTNFIEILINSPLSIQKRGLRLAFETFDSRDLKDLVSHVWKKKKNVSLRKIIYKLFFNKVKTEKERVQIELFELLKELTLSIHQDDDDEIFNEYFNGNPAPENLKGAYLQVCWKTVLGLPENNRNIEHRTLVMKALTNNLSLIDDEFCSSLINNHVRKILVEQKLRPETNPYIDKLNEMTWNLVASYILDIPDETKQEKNLNLVTSIVQECIHNWNVDHDSETFVFQSFFKSFVANLDSNYTYYTGLEHQRLAPVFEYFIEMFENKFNISDIYSYLWDWKLALLVRKVIDGREELDKDAHIEFGLQLGNLVKELKDKNRYYASFFQKVYQKVSRFVGVLTTIKAPPLTDPDVLILIAYGLTLSEIFESYIFALEILPQDLSVRPLVEKELIDVIKKIKEQNNQELTTFMKEKFVYSGHKVMKIVL